MSLTLHIGLPKTGTTSIQSILVGQSNFVGKFSGSQRLSPHTASKVVRELRHWSVVGLRSPVGVDYPRSPMSGGLGAVSKKMFEVRAASTKTNWIQSDEDLSLPGPPEKVGFIIGTGMGWKPNSWEEMPITRFLENLDAKFSIDLVISVRDQKTLLPSLYAESGRFEGFRSQSHFEDQIDKFLTKKRFFLDYEHMKSAFVNILGENHVHFLPLENSAYRPKNLQELGFPHPANAGESNVSKSAPDSWRIKSPLGWRDDYIALTPEIVARITAEYMESNLKFHSQLGLGP